MGRAVAQGMIDSGFPASSLVMTAKSEDTCASASSDLGVEVLRENPLAVRDADIAVVCVKPKDVAKVVSEISAPLKEEAPIVSIAAGITNSVLTEACQAQHAVIRAMPNTPCQIHKGITVLSPSEGVTSSQLELSLRIFDCLGRTYVLDEQHMDTVTGLSASGPAFIFVMIESLADGAVARGLPRQIAIEMAAQMVFGAASMVLATGRHPAALKDDVTTPAGCTIAGLLALEDGRIRSVISRAIEIASQRASELGEPKV